LDHSLPVPHDVGADDLEEWHERFTRTLAEALRRAGSDILGIESRELAATVRSRPFGYPEVILYDTVAGGAGYCRMLIGRYSVRKLLEKAVDALDCRAGCTHACRACLQDYDNQLLWEKLDRQPVLNWVKCILGMDQPPNPYMAFNAAPFEVKDGTPLLLAELERADHFIAVAPTLFDIQTAAESRESFLAAPTIAFVRKLVAWMAGAPGRRAEIALAQPPTFSAEFSSSLAIWHELQPRLADGSLKFWKLPRSFDGRAWPRALTSPGREGGVAWFSSSGVSNPFFDEPLPIPLWKAPGFPPETVRSFRNGWEELKITAPSKPSDLTLREYRPGEPRNFACDFAFCRGEFFALLRIEDPYVLADDWKSRALCGFLRELATLWQKWPAKIEIKTRDTGDQNKLIADLERELKQHGVSIDIRRVVSGGPDRIDFHDRRIIFQPDIVNPRRRVTVLLTGGIDRYLDRKAECGVIAHRSL